ncbi:trypsin-like serine peptidase, partial [Microbispora hainanensis]
MKRTLTLGGIAVGLLASAVVATPAHADSVPHDTLASSNFAAKQVAAFWFGERMANLRNAKPYNVETRVSAKHVSTGGASADSKPGVVGSSGDKKATSSTKNVNLPKTTGKVFFIGADKKPHWCTATAVQSRYKNLVATAGHCVYDTKSNKATLDKWVFVPGYYQGKTPWGIYVGKTAYTHYDFDV